jgi:polysaccharide biosynthesis transport protein
MDSLIDILRSLLRHQYKLMVVPVLTMSLIYYFTRNLPQQYRTETRMYLNLQESKGLSLSDEDLKQYQVHSYFQNTVELLKSKRTLEKVRWKVIEQALTDSPNYFHQANEALVSNRLLVSQRMEELKAGQQLNLQAPLDQIIAAFLQQHHLTDDGIRNSLVAFRIMDSNFMKVELTAEHPEKAQLLARLFIEALIEENKELTKNKIKGHKDIIEGLVRQAKEDLNQKIKRLEQYKSNNTIINLGEHTKAIVVYLVQLEGQRANLLARIAASSRGRKEVLTTVQTGNEVSLDLSGHQEILELKNQLKRLNREALVQSFGQQKIVDPTTLDRNIEQTKGQIQTKLVELARKTPYDPSQFQLDLASRYLNFDLDAETSADMVDIINTEIQRVNQYSKRFAPFESTIGAYEQEIATANHVYLTLLNKLSLTESMEYGSGENVIEVIDPPQVPTQPQPSKRWLMIISGGLAVFALMAGFWVVVHLLDASVSTVEKLESYSSLPVLAAIPQPTARRSSEAQHAWTIVENQQWMQLAQLVLTRCRGDENVLLLTTAFGEQGQQVMALQLQKFLKEANLQVALILANHSENEVTSEVDMREWIRHQGLMANREKIMGELKKLRGEHDVVIVLPSSMDQAAELNFWMEQANHLVLAFQANRVFTKIDRRAEEFIRKSPISFLGTILTGVKPEFMEDYLGGLPTQKSALRKWIKKILTRNLR